LIVAGIGARPLAGFMQEGIKVYFDNVSPTVEESIKRFLNNELEEMNPSQACGVH
jgi:predicted Fe-Mo cluster-binding NifX family protein